MRGLPLEPERRPYMGGGRNPRLTSARNKGVRLWWHLQARQDHSLWISHVEAGLSPACALLYHVTPRVACLIIVSLHLGVCFHCANKVKVAVGYFSDSACICPPPPGICPYHLGNSLILLFSKQSRLCFVWHFCWPYDLRRLL